MLTMGKVRKWELGFMAAIILAILPLGLWAAEVGKHSLQKETDGAKESAQIIKLPSAGGDSERENKIEQDEDILEQALSLIGEADGEWKEGRIEEALERLDRAYSLMLDTNGDPKVARQKDDVRLLISKKIITLYSTTQGGTRGKRGEIPLIINDDVEKEIRSFLGPERDFFIASYQRSFLYRGMIKEELKKAGLPEELSWLPLVESGFKIAALSPARALGLWQFIPSTGYKYGLNRDDWIDERLDPRKSTKAAISYLKELHGMFGDWLTVLAAYNCGEGRVVRVIASQQINYLDRFWDLYQALPYETARYVPRFLATLHIIKDPKKYGIDLEERDTAAKHLTYDTVTINKHARLKDIAELLGVDEEELAFLNSELRFRITPERAYELKIPKDSKEKFLAIANDIPPYTDPLPLARKQKRRVYLTHKVRPGETLASIAKRYGTSAKAVQSANHLKRAGVRAGQLLRVPIVKAGTTVPSRSTPKVVTVYRVKKGDTLSTIAARFGVSTVELKRINSMKKDTITVGQVIRLREKPKSTSKKQATTPSTSHTTYVVKKNDTLLSIAEKYNVDVNKLKSLNNIRGDGGYIKVGQRLVIN